MKASTAGSNGGTLPGATTKGGIIAVSYPWMKSKPLAPPESFTSARPWRLADF
jgi:hypothetical protein